VAHYSVVVAVENRRLVAWATRDFLHPVPAAALVIAAGDEVLWFCESAELRLVFEASPFQSGIREITVPRGRSSPPEIGAGRAGRQRDVFRYAIRSAIGADRPADGVAHIIVEARSAAGADSNHSRQAKSGANSGHPQDFILDTREGEILDRAQGEVAMAKHKLKLKKGTGNKVECDYQKDDKNANASGAYPYLIVKSNDKVEFEAPADAALVVAFGAAGSPFVGGTNLLRAGKGTKTDIQIIRDPGAPTFFAFKYTAVLLYDLDADFILEDPHVIIDNEG